MGLDWIGFPEHFPNEAVIQYPQSAIIHFTIRPMNFHWLNRCQGLGFCFGFWGARGRRNLSLLFGVCLIKIIQKIPKASQNGHSTEGREYKKQIRVNSPGFPYCRDPSNTKSHEIPSVLRQKCPVEKSSQKCFRIGVGLKGSGCEWHQCWRECQGNSSTFFIEQLRLSDAPTSRHSIFLRARS